MIVWISRFLFWLLRTAIICILVWVLGAVTLKCFGGSFPWPCMVLSHANFWLVAQHTPGWASVDLFIFSLSPAFYSGAGLTCDSSHLDFLGLPAPFPPMGEPTGSAWVPSQSTDLETSQGSKLGICVACVVCFLSPGSLSLIACLKSSLLLFHTFVRFFVISRRRLNLVSFFPSWLEVMIVWVYFAYSLLTSDTEYILFIDHSCVSLVKNLFRALAISFLSSSVYFFCCGFFFPLFALQKVLVCLEITVLC